MVTPTTTSDPKTEGRNGRAAAPSALRVGDLLLAAGLLTPEQLQEALRLQKEGGRKQLLGQILVEQKFVTDEQVGAVLAEACGVPFARVSPSLADPRVLELLPREFLEKQSVAPLFHVEGVLTVAVSEPTNVFLVEEIERLAGARVQVVASLPADIDAVLQAHLPSANVFVIDDLVDDASVGDIDVIERAAAEPTDLTDVESAAGDSPVIKLVNYLIFCAVQEGASDIHIEPSDGSLRVRYRVDGRLHEKMRPPHTLAPAVVSRIKIMAAMDISERRVPQDGGITVMLGKRPVDLRVSTMPGKFGEKVVIRIIDNQVAMLGLDKLGFEPDMLATFRRLLAMPNGIFLVTGPTGSGKSSTLYASLNEVADDSINICTVEDPVEYNLDGINQFQTREKAGFTFATALRALLRQDPDVIMVGEIRDLETARIAAQAALTGHLVLSTLHTNDAPSAVTRLTDIGVESFLVAASLRGVLAQRLLRKICEQCKEPAPLDAAAERALYAAGVDTRANPPRLFRGAGCKRCRGTGYKGRLGVFELFVPDDGMLDAISQGVTLQQLRRIAAEHGHRSLVDDAARKVLEGRTTIEEMVRATAA